MVVHTPSKLDALRQSAAERRHAANAGGVPPSVRTAGNAAAAAVDTEGQEDLLGDTVDPADAEAVVHDFDKWDGDSPPGQVVEAKIHAATEQDLGQEHGNVTVSYTHLTLPTILLV